MRSVFKNFYFPLLLVVITFSNCVKELVPANNGYVPKPVIWAILNLDSTVTIVTSGNKGLYNEDIVNIPVIDMILYKNGIPVDQLFSQSITSDSQSHRFSVKPESNNNYSIKLFTANLEITGSAVMPNPIPPAGDITLGQGENARLSFSITDDLAFNDAYQFSIGIYHYGQLTDTATDTIIRDYYHTSPYDKFEEPALNYNFLGLNAVSANSYTFPVSDDLFNGKRKTFLFNIQNPVSNTFFIPRNIIKGPPVSDKLIAKKQYILIRSRKISQEYYKFILSENKNNAIFGTPYFNPINVYSNITGGLGLMAGMAERTDTVWIRK